MPAKIQTAKEAHLKAEARLKKERERLEEIALNKKIEEEALKYGPWSRLGRNKKNTQISNNHTVHVSQGAAPQVGADEVKLVSPSRAEAVLASVSSKGQAAPVRIPDTPASKTEMTPAERYRAELQEQINLKRARKEMEKQKEKEWDLKKEKEIASYDPFGRSGCGAPIRSVDGTPVANLRMHAGKSGTNLITVRRCLK